MASMKSAARVVKSNGRQAATVAAPTIPEALAQAILRGLGKVEVAPLSPGKHRVRGTATIRLDVWLTKGEATTARQAVPKADILALALESLGLAPEALSQAINAAAMVVLSGKDWAAPEVAEALTACKAMMPDQPREGSTQYAGEIEIVDWEE